MPHIARCPASTRRPDHLVHPGEQVQWLAVSGSARPAGVPESQPPQLGPTGTTACRRVQVGRSPNHFVFVLARDEPWSRKSRASASARSSDRASGGARDAVGTQILAGVETGRRGLSILSVREGGPAFAPFRLAPCDWAASSAITRAPARSAIGMQQFHRRGLASTGLHLGMTRPGTRSHRKPQPRANVDQVRPVNSGSRPGLAGRPYGRTATACGNEGGLARQDCTRRRRPTPCRPQGRCSIASVARWPGRCSGGCRNEPVANSAFKRCDSAAPPMNAQRGGGASTSLPIPAPSSSATARCCAARSTSGTALTSQPPRILRSPSSRLRQASMAAGHVAAANPGRVGPASKGSVSGRHRAGICI
jgi:hypothetical protein